MSELRSNNFRWLRSTTAFTLIELAVSLLILSLVFVLVGIRSGSFAFWQEEAFIRKLNETIVFLHHQAVIDQAFYRLEFNLKNNTWRVGAIRVEEEDPDKDLVALASDAGSLSLELAAFLNPSVGSAQTLIPPPSFPSLAQAQPLPEGVSLQDIRTMRGKQAASDSELAYIIFSPRGFSEFAVLHLRLSNGSPLTIMVNPFTGLTDLYREYRDFEWTYGRKKGNST